MTHLTFKYDLDKDVENFLLGQKAINATQPTLLDQEFKDQHDEISESTVRKFLGNKAKQEDIDFESRIKEIEGKWRPIEDLFIARCEEMFGIQLQDLITGYISLNQRCTYNWRNNYFFISYTSPTPQKTIMHELLHFYTHHKFGSLGIEPKRFNEIKESLTVILNTDFSDLMSGAKDDGYKPHHKMRGEIVEMRKAGKSIDEIVSSLQ